MPRSYRYKFSRSKSAVTNQQILNTLERSRLNDLVKIIKQKLDKERYKEVES